MKFYLRLLITEDIFWRLAKVMCLPEKDIPRYPIGVNLNEIFNNQTSQGVIVPMVPAAPYGNILDYFWQDPSMHLTEETCWVTANF